MARAARTAGAAKRYGQACGLARALDLLGERWTLLVVRELVLGPKRYSDLVRRLRGVPTNLLGERLKQLVAHGLVERRVLRPPAPATVYRLTDVGRGLTPALLALMRWGEALPWSAEEGDVQVSGAWDALNLLVVNPLDRPAAAPDLAVTVDFGDEQVRIDVRGAELAVTDGAHDDPDAVLSCDPFAFHALRRGTLRLADAVADGRASVAGSREAVEQLLGLAAPGGR